MKKYISIVLCIAIVLTLVPMELNASTGILEIVYDEQKHQALTYSVRYTPSDAPLQAFAEGWNISIGSIEVLVKVAPSFSGGDRTYVIPLTKGYAKGDATSFLNGSCIEDLVPKSKKEEFYSIISRETGSTITVNAKIQKYKYSNGNYTATGVIANTSTELRNKFSEFSENFLNTTINDYYNLKLPITAEPVVVKGKPVADMAFSDTSDTVKNIYLGESFTLEDRSYATAEGTSIVGWNVKAGSYSATYITNASEFFRTYTPVTTGTIKYTLNYVHDSNSTKSENPAKTLTVVVLPVPPPPPEPGDPTSPSQGKVTYEYYKDSIKPDNLLNAIDTSISNPYVVILPDTYGNGLKFSSATYSGEAVTTDGSCKNEDSITIANTKKDLLIQAIYKKGATGPTNDPPVAVIEVNANSLAKREPDYPDKVMAGDTITLDGRKSYDYDGQVVAWEWYRITGGDFTPLGTGKTITTHFMNVGYEEVLLIVYDDTGDSGDDYRTIEIVPPVPKAAIKYSGIPKENRKEILDATDSWSPAKYPINSWVWSIEPTNMTIKGTNINFTAEEKQSIIQNMKYHLPLTGELKDVLFKMDKEFKDKYRAAHELKADEAIKINYKVTLTVTNTYGRSHTATSTLPISEDLPPIAGFFITKIAKRNHEDSYYATLELTNSNNIEGSYSPDGDIIDKSICFIAYNSDNSFNAIKKETSIEDYKNETWYYSVDGRTWNAVGLPYNKILSDFDSYGLATSNIQKYTYKTKEVGKYLFNLIVYEAPIPDNETMREFLTSDDMRMNHTFD